MIAPNFRYIKGTQNNRETVEIDIVRADGMYITTCVINVQMLLAGISAFPCGNGDDVTLEAEQRLTILHFIKDERAKLVYGVTIKTLEGWYESGLPSFQEYCSPGDEVSEDIVEYFINSVPPILMRSSCTQAGEAFSAEMDDKGRYKPTYTTFHKISGGKWVFDGYCFEGNNENKADKRTSLDRLIEMTKRGLEAIK